MVQKCMLLLGTNKGAFFLESDAHRRSWTLRGPFCDTLPINYAVADEYSGAIFCGGGNRWRGPAIWKTKDFGDTWTSSNGGFETEAEDAVRSVWCLAPTRRSLYAGVGPADLYSSDDEGESWQQVQGLQSNPTRAEWQPGGAGLILHCIVPHPHDDRQMWVGISAAGVFHTADGGKTWEPRNHGTRADFMPEGQQHPEFGQCVHAIAMAPGNPDLLYQQNHCGMYRSKDGGKTWQSIETGLPTSFGFPVAVHPRDPDTLYFVPLNGDTAGRYVPNARAAVWRSRDGGKTWKDLRRGLPQKDTYFAVLRQAMATDRLEPAGIYFGTNTGTVFASTDEGESWLPIAEHLPLIHSVKTYIIES